MEIMQDVVVREAIETDIPFIYSSWLKSYFEQGKLFQKLRRRIYFPNQHEVITKILARKTTNVLVIVSKEDENIILGYLVAEILNKPVIHFAYIKEAFRRKHLMSFLLQTMGISLESDSGVIFTHYTEQCNIFVKVYKDKLVFNPYLAFIEAGRI